MTSNDTSAVLAGPDTAIHTVFDEVSSAWEDGDTDAFVAWYADDATAILPGFYLPGKEAIRTSMAAAFAGPLRAHGASTRYGASGISGTAQPSPSPRAPPSSPLGPERPRRGGSAPRGSCPGVTAGGSSRPTTAARKTRPDRAREPG